VTPEIVVVAIIAGLAGGGLGAVAIGALQAWMARPKGGRRSPMAYAAPRRPDIGETQTFSHRVSGGGPFDRFNDRAKRILALAQDEAIRFNHNYIGTEHLLLGLVREGEGVAARVLDELHVEVAKVRTALEFIIGRGDTTTSPSEITLSPRTKKVIELALDEARKLGHSYVGSEHILLGLVREGEGIASGVLESLGISLPRVRQVTLEVLGQPHQATPPDEPTPRGRGVFSRFHARSKRALALAQNEAFTMGHDYIGTEHLLLAIVRMEGPVSHVVEAFNLTLEQLRAEVLKVAPRTERETPPAEITLTPRVKKVFELAAAEAVADQVHPEHLLLAIGTEGEGKAAKILIALGATPERVRDIVNRPQGPAA
jgi:ATP-dependent Clp protease ATP-binding subunit ClpA